MHYLKSTLITLGICSLALGCVGATYWMYGYFEKLQFCRRVLAVNEDQIPEWAARERCEMFAKGLTPGDFLYEAEPTKFTI